MDADPNPEVAPSTSLEPQHEMNDTPGQEYVSNQEITGATETIETTETTDSTVVDGTHDAGYNHEEQAHQNTYPAEFTSSQQNYFPAEDEPSSSRFSSPTMSYQQNPQQSVSRPGSGLSSGGERYGYPSSQPEQNQKQAAVPSKNSVVIKVGMVGDAQIGKTSLMVKYVEGSWDEDYIQTLGECGVFCKSMPGHSLTGNNHRRQLYGEDHFDSKYRNYFLDLGSGRTTRVCQHASSGLQRCSCYSIHVRSYAQEYTQFDQGVVPSGPRLQ